ncbi:MAG: helix-turn-helix transcriptional regulator [Bacteroidetes bacterium]|nr:helix-turn-helix transcriptional regulator [Bacteroidota bacterium]
MLVLNIKKEMAAKNITNMLPWLVKIGIPSRSAIKLLSGKAKHVYLPHIELICLHMNCTPNDLFSWTPAPHAQQRLSNHPLQEIKGGTETPNVQHYVKQLSRKGIAEVEKYAQKKLEEEVANRQQRIAERKKKETAGK